MTPFRQSRLLMALGVATILVGSCGRSPSTPTPVTGTPTPPVIDSPVRYIAAPASPAESATVVSRGEVFFTADNAADPGGAPILITFELAADAGFSVGRISSVVPQTPGGQTTLPLNFSYPSSAIGSTMFWRVRAGAGEVLGDYSPARTFILGQPTPDAGALFAEPPTPVRPANGAYQSSRARVAVRPGKYSNGGGVVRFEVASEPSFSRVITTCLGNDTVPGGADVDCSFSLKTPGVYYWRAQIWTSHIGDSLAQGIRGPYSDVWSFTVISETIQAPALLAPASNTIVHQRPTVVVANAERTGAVGPFAYRFELSSSGGLLTSALVPEENGQTAWTVPFDLMIGATYQARIRAIDLGSGVESSDNFVTFTIVGLSEVLLTLDITPPADSRCSPFSVAATSGNAIGASPYRMTTTGTFGMDLTMSGGVYSGTIGGVVGDYRIYAESTGKARTATTATLTPEGTLSGTFDGFEGWYSDYGHSCTGKGFGWTLRPR